MSLSIGQITAISYPAVLNDKRKAVNQWAESAFLREAERQGMVVRKSFGSVLEVELDYRANQGAGFLASSLAPVSLSETDFVTAAQYDIAELSVPMTWSKKTEVQNPTENQKIAFVENMISNALDTHDDKIERAIFGTSTNNFLGLQTHVPTSGQGSDGGIDASVEAWWRPVQATYVDDTDIESALTSAYNSAMKGSGSALMPTMLASDGPTQALFEGTQQANQRWVDTDELKAGFKIIAFKTARWVFSQYGTSSVYGLNKSSFRIVASKDYFRERGETQEIQNAHGFVSKIYSALQSYTDNRSRLFVVHL